VLVDPDGDLVSEWKTPNLPYEAELNDQRELVGGPYLNGTAASSRVDTDIIRPARMPLIALHHTVGLPAFIQWWHVAGLYLIILIRALIDIPPLLNAHLFGRDGDILR